MLNVIHLCNDTRRQPAGANQTPQVCQRRANVAAREHIRRAELRQPCRLGNLSGLQPLDAAEPSRAASHFSRRQRNRIAVPRVAVMVSHQCNEAVFPKPHDTAK